jgi:hypothetical protein
VGLFGMVLSDFQNYIKMTWLGWFLAGLVWYPIVLVTMLIPALALAVGVALHFDEFGMRGLTQLVIRAYGELPGDLRQLLPRPGLTLPDWGWLCVVVGALGVSSQCVYAFMEIPWRLKQMRQVRTLPRSKTRSVAIGLAEFEGIARATAADGLISPLHTQEARPFHLEDETGRILVDPGETTVRPRSAAGQSLMLNEIEEGIREGDRVYVIGNVQMREGHAPDALDSERLVVRPLRQALVSSPVARLLFPERNQPADRDAPNIFIVDKGHEHKVLARLRLALLDFCLFAALYLGASLWLVQTGWPWLWGSAK